jgi:hypothetical protein
MRIFIFLFAVLLAGCGNENGSFIGGHAARPKSQEELRADLKRLELRSPLLYLSHQKVTLHPQQKKIRRAGLFRPAEYAPDGAIIEGAVSSKAAFATFKDVVVKISFYSKTETLIKEENHVFYEYYEPGSTKYFSLKLDKLPEAYARFSLEITGATPMD